MSTPLTDSINALTAYANETTGASDTTLSDAVGRLCEGYGGLSLPDGCEIGAFTPVTDSYTVTVSHNLGEIPKSAFCIAVVNRDFTNIPDTTILLNELIADPQTGEFDISLPSSRNRRSVVSKGDGVYLTTDTYTTYPASMTATEVTFATGRYYSGKFKTGVNYVYILTK